MAFKRWYAVQVETGREQVVAVRMRQAADGLAVPCVQLAAARSGQAPMPEVVRVGGSSSAMSQNAGKSLGGVGNPGSSRPAPCGYAWLLEECFVPQRLAPARRRTAACEGPPEMEQQVLFPGYLVVSSPAPELLCGQMRRQRVFARILGAGDVFTPLSDDEMDWLDRFTHRGRRAVGMSTAYAVPGARVQVVDGPLVGCEALISRVNHRRKIAYVRLTMCGREVEVELGLRVLRKRRLGGGAALPAHGLTG